MRSIFKVEKFRRKNFCLSVVGVYDIRKMKKTHLG